MPIFEYACKQCSHTFETLVRAQSTPRCPKCQSVELEKQLSVFATTSSAEAAPPVPASCGGCAFRDQPGACAAAH